MRSFVQASVSVILFGLFLFLAFPLVSAGGYVSAHAEVRPGIFNGRGEDISEEPVFSKNLTEYLRIPLPENVFGENVQVTENPYKKLILIRIEGAGEDFYRDYSFSGKLTGITDLKYGYSGGVSTVELKTEKVCTPVTDYDDESFYIRAVPLSEMYRHVVAIDLGHVGNDIGSYVYGISEREIIFRVADKLKDKLSGGRTVVYMTSDGFSEASEKERAEMTESLDADLLICIHTGADARTRVKNGTEAVTSHSLRNAAERLTKRISEDCDEKDLGVTEEQIPGVTEYTTVPFIRLNLGYITNKEEALKMNTDDYAEKAAEAIADTVKGMWQGN